jgi:effector-binding domain-containing protein
MSTEPTLLRRNAQHYAGIPIEVTLTEWHKANALVPEIYEWPARNGIEPGGGPIGAGTLPAGPYAVLIHQGHPDRQEQSHAALQEWAAAQGLALDKAGEGRDAVWAARCETYLTDPAEQPDPEQWSTELAYLIKES